MKASRTAPIYSVKNQSTRSSCRLRCKARCRNRYLHWHTARRTMQNSPFLFALFLLLLAYHFSDGCSRGGRRAMPRATRMVRNGERTSGARKNGRGCWEGCAVENELPKRVYTNWRARAREGGNGERRGMGPGCSGTGSQSRPNLGQRLRRPRAAAGAVPAVPPPIYALPRTLQTPRLLSLSSATICEPLHNVTHQHDFC